MFVIVGLGNPTKKYEKTRHNVGFEVISLLSQKYDIPVKDRKARAFVGNGVIAGEKVLLVMPQTFMNLSGESLRPLMDFYKLDPTTQLVVIYDDINLAPGQLRIRRGGSAGGHNGMKNIIAHLGTQDFMRIRVGVGEKPQGRDLADYVLGHFSKGEQEKMEEAYEEAAAAVALLVQGKIDEAMNSYNKKKTENDG